METNTTMRVSAGRRRGGFTLIELMVVASIIAVLMVLTAPAIVGMLRSSQLAQTENQIRAALLQARCYAIETQQVAGLRFQPDGNIVLCWDPSSYSKNWGQLQTPGGNFIGGSAGVGYRMRSNYRNTKVYDMRAVPKMEPMKLSGGYRVTMYKTNAVQGDINDPNYIQWEEQAWINTWQSNANWLCGEQQFLFPVILYSPTGRIILSEAVFHHYPDTPSTNVWGSPITVPAVEWYPDDSGDFARLVNRTYHKDPRDFDPIFGPQEGASNLTGAPVVTSLKIFDYDQAREFIKPTADQMTDEDWHRVFMAISGSGPELVIDIQTGQIIRLDVQGQGRFN